MGNGADAPVAPMRARDAATSFWRRPPALAVLAALFLLTTSAVVVPFDVGRTFGIKGDEATYVSMALSLAYDGDLKFRPEDLHRFQRLYGSGPEGIFLKQGYHLGVDVAAKWPPVSLVKTPNPPRAGLEFGKPFAYAVAAAPFVRIAGLRGLLLFNVLLLASVMWMAWRFASARIGPAAGVLLAVAFVGASVIGVYAVWLTSEVFNFAVVFAAYFLWLYKEVAPPAVLERHGWLGRPSTDVAAAALLGFATFSKPPNVLLVLPLMATLCGRRRWRRCAGVCAIFLLTSAGAFALNGVVSGELNYQGGDRRTFYGRYPYSDPDATFDRMGHEMVTARPDSESLFAPQVLWPLLEHNAVYFFVGRHAGLIPYFFPGVLILALWLVRPRSWALWQILSALTLAASVLLLLVFAPYSWSGGGGPIGNRYFLSLYPVLFFLLPLRAPRWPAIFSFLGLVVVGPLLLHPLSASKQPWHNAEHGIVRALPVELTMVDDLPVRLGPRGRIPFGPEPAALLYFLDEATFSPEGRGFWVAGDAATDIIVRTERPIARVKFLVRSGVPNRVSLAMGGRRASLDLQPDETATVTLDVGSGVVYTHGSRAYVLSMETSNGFVPRLVDRGSADTRFLGMFVQPEFLLQPLGSVTGGG